MPQSAKTLWIIALTALFGARAAADIVPPVNWDRSEAAHTAAATDTGPVREDLLRLAAAGSSRECLSVRVTFNDHDF